MFQNLTDRLQNIFSGLRSKGRLSQADIDLAMTEIRLALLEADVNFGVVKAFVERTKERCSTAEVLQSLTPAQNVVKVVMDELTALLGTEQAKLVFSSRIPNVIMLVGLQGSGKTTAAAKLAYRLKKQGHSPLLAACDVYRPAAADQLQTLGDEMQVRVFRGDGTDPVAIAKGAVRDAIDNLRDVVIVDTAGRLHVDEQMMDEAAAIKEAVNPETILMVVDAMTGQDVVNVATAFAEKVDFDGVIMSKMDGDARGGAALSLREATGKPIYFISSGERPDSLEEFYPDRMAKRILGMGDMVSLIEKAVETQEEQISREKAERIAKATFTLDDFLDSMKQIKKMGGLSSLMSALPGGDKALAQGGVDDSEIKRMEAIVYSMTKEERQKPGIINGPRRARIAAGAGVAVHDVNSLLTRFDQMRKMMSKMTSQMNGMMGGKKKRPTKGGKNKKKNKNRGSMSNKMSAKALSKMTGLDLSQFDLSQFDDLLK